MRTLHLDNIHVYEARSNYWVGQILQDISGGESLYTDESTQWGFRIHCNAEHKPHSVEFNNGTLWSFCASKHSDAELKQFAADFPDGFTWARVERIYSDSMHLGLYSENASLNDLLIWHYPPRGGKHGDEMPRCAPPCAVPVCI